MISFIFLCFPLLNLKAQSNFSGDLVYGLGIKNCGEYLSDRSKSTFAFYGTTFNRYGDWGHGYLSGSFEQPKFEVTPLTIVAFLDNFCKNKPLLRVHVGVQCLIDESLKKPKDLDCR